MCSLIERVLDRLLDNAASTPAANYVAVLRHTSRTNPCKAQLDRLTVRCRTAP